MKAYLLHRDRDNDLQRPLPQQEAALIQDLELKILFTAMAASDEFLFDVAKHVILVSEGDLGTILYRQDILGDCIDNASIVRDLYAITVETITREKKNYWSILSNSPAGILHRSVEVMQLFMEMLKKLRGHAREHEGKFKSEGFRTLLTMLQRELEDDYFDSIMVHLKELRFRDGVLISAALGKGNKGINYMLSKPKPTDRPWWKRLFTSSPPTYRYVLSPHDEAGARAMSELNDQGINLAADALAQANDHILSFFTTLRTELAFYVGCLNLQDRLSEIGEPVCMPVPLAGGERQHAFEDVYDVCLALKKGMRVVGNDVDASHKELIVIIGANQGGKSTLLRSIGVAQLMMQAGMFVPARSFRANVCAGLFTHFKREEDRSMRSGKLDEELSRMSGIVDKLSANSMVLFNESFAATNEREGSEIARQIVSALLERHVKVFFVTHMYELSHGFYERNLKTAIYLRAERGSDGERTYKLVEGEPLPTSYGIDSYHQIFGAADKTPDDRSRPMMAAQRRLWVEK